ncbi:hypothetical protein K438DRAFT_1771133 [Mycena galopus ATCC 62051]|nr:hypothetical protein K438DRAFT_1771133 [Mycena galopus ATCC 62051]
MFGALRGENGYPRLKGVGSDSDIPAEITHEIAEHNADDLPTSLVSQTTRLSVIKHIFPTINFQSVEDFLQWLDMLGRTASHLGEESQIHQLQGARLAPAWAEIRHPVVDVATILAPLAFPSVAKLHLDHTSFTFRGLTKILRACGQLKSLSFRAATLAEGDEFNSKAVRRTPVDLSALEDLTVIECGQYQGNDVVNVLRLIQHSQPGREITGRRGFPLREVLSFAG